MREICFARVKGDGPTRFEAQRQLARLAESLSADQLRALNELLKNIDKSYTAEKLSGLTPEVKLGLAVIGIAAVGTVSALAASDALSGGGNQTDQTGARQ